MISPLKKVQQSKISLNKYLLQERFLISTKRYPSLSQLCKQYVKASVRLNSSVYYINTYQQVETNERPHFQQLSSPDQQAHERLSGSTLSKTLMKSQSLGSLSDKVLHGNKWSQDPKSHTDTPLSCLLIQTIAKFLYLIHAIAMGNIHSS